MIRRCSAPPVSKKRFHRSCAEKDKGGSLPSTECYLAQLTRGKVDRRKWRVARPEYDVERRKKATGKVCDACGEDDSKVMWSVTSVRHCNTCFCRGRRNGWCKCGGALYRVLTKAGLRAGRRYECRECEGEKVGAKEARLWDLHWCAEERGRVTWATVSKVYGSSRETAKQAMYRLWPKFEGLGIGAAWVEGTQGSSAEAPVPSAIVFDPVAFEALFRRGGRDVG